MEGGVGTLTFQFDVTLTTIHVNLNLSLIGSRITSLQIIELLHEQEAVVGISQPTVSISIDLTVLVGLVGSIPSGSISIFEIHQSCGPDALSRGLEEDKATFVDDTGNLPRSHLAGVVALVDDRVGDYEGTVFLIGSKGLADAESQSWSYLTGQNQRVVFLFDAVGLFIELGYWRPVPLFLRTGPEGRSKRLRELRL